MHSSFGKNIRITVFGGSHEPQIGVTIEGLPEGFSIDTKQLLAFLGRRAPGNSPYATPRKEADQPIFEAGLQDGITLGGPLTAIIKNTNVRPLDYSRLSHIPRPGHADYTAFAKYGGKLNMSGGGPFSGRMTAPLCIAGGIALQMLKAKGIFIGGHIYSVGNVNDDPFDPANVEVSLLNTLSSMDFPTISDKAGEDMKTLIRRVAMTGDSVGGIVEACALGLPPGLGGPMYDGIESVLSPIFFGIPAVKGVEFGAGFGAAILNGSVNNDAFYIDGNTVKTRTNNHGGILGGISTGMPLICRTAFKPTPSIGLEQDSVDLLQMKETKLSIVGRHDPCVVLRAVPTVEAALALGLLDLMLEKEDDQNGSYA